MQKYEKNSEETYKPMYENRTATQVVFESLRDYDFEDVEDEFPVEDMEAMEIVSTFYEYVYTHAVRIQKKNKEDVTGREVIGSDRELYEFVSEKVGKEISRQTLQNWLLKAYPAEENLNRICDALEMTKEEKEEFVSKYSKTSFHYRHFREDIRVYADRCGYREYSKEHSVASFVSKQCKKEIKEINPETILNLMSKQAPATEAERKTMYHVCSILERF